MRTKILSVLVVAALAACSNEHPSPAASTPAATPATPVTHADPGPAGQAASPQQLFDLIPGLRFDIPLHAVENRRYSTDDGKDRQGFTLEFTEGDVTTVMAAVRSAFVAAGYKARSDFPTNDNGVLKLDFSKRGQPSPFVAVYPSPGKKPVTAGAVGRVWISWTVPAGGNRG